MKKQAILLAALVAAASAQADGYATVAVGPSHDNGNCAGTTSCRLNDTGAKFVGGYGFGNGFSLEAGYISFGKFSAATSTESDSLKTSAFVVGGAYALPLGSDWGMNFRLGLAQVKAKLDAVSKTQSLSDSESTTKPYVGLGVTYAVSKAVKVELGFDSTQANFNGFKATQRLISLGATFAF